MLLGLIRDVTNSYPICIHAQSVCISLCAIAWGIEYLIQFLKRRRSIQAAATITNGINGANGANGRTQREPQQITNGTISESNHSK